MRASPRPAGRRRPRCAAAGPYAANALQTPHSGYHWDGTARRFFEGWYFRVLVPDTGKSFAIIYSAEDPAGGRPASGIGVQVMGPEDGDYLCHFSRNVHQFWAARHTLALGAGFQHRGAGARAPAGMAAAEEFRARVAAGFQASATWHQGRVQARSVGAQGTVPNTVKECAWEYATEPVAGWGPRNRPQSTAGWLAALPVFEPHWQILMANGRSSGRIVWGDEVHEFTDAPSYAEKNWGGAFPEKWFWVQCNSFGGGDELSITAVGARRKLPGLGASEDVGLIGLHLRGEFIALTPADSTLEWEVAPWGEWRLEGRNARHRVVVEATTATRGTLLRAPLEDGLTPFCRDTFRGDVRVSVHGAGGELLARAESSTGALETGGGPWLEPWRIPQAEIKQPLRSVVNLPFEPRDWLPRRLYPPGL